MKFNKNTIFGGVVAIVILAIIVMALKRDPSPSPSSNGNKFIVYGTEWCGYTTKQRKHLDKKYGPRSHKFVDCDKTHCPGINAFPVTKTPSGDMVKGFNVDI